MAHAMEPLGLLNIEGCDPRPRLGHVCAVLGDDLVGPVDHVVGRRRIGMRNEQPPLVVSGAKCRGRDLRGVILVGPISCASGLSSAQGIRIEHSAVECALTGRFIKLGARFYLEEPVSLARVYFSSGWRKSGGK